eukprot:9075151-Alexandrium_andersonii.AAC.1
MAVSPRSTPMGAGEGRRELQGPSPRSSSSSPRPPARSCPSSDVRFAADPSLPSVRHTGTSPRSPKREKRARVADRKEELAPAQKPVTGGGNKTASGPSKETHQ